MKETTLTYHGIKSDNVIVDSAKGHINMGKSLIFSGRLLEGKNVLGGLVFWGHVWISSRILDTVILVWQGFSMTNGGV